MAVNMNMHSDGEGSINEALRDTIAAVFPYVATADVQGSTNRELFACLDAPAAERLERGIGALPRGELRSLMQRVAERLVAERGGSLVLSDDRAPVELLGMRAIDALIADELVRVRALYARDGIRGVIESFS